MGQRPHSDEQLKAVADAYIAAGRNASLAARIADVSRTTFHSQLVEAARRGFVGTEPVIPGFRISQVTTGRDGKPLAIQQKPEHGEEFEVPAGHQIKGVSALVDPEGREIVKWIKTKEGIDSLESIRTVADELNKTLKRAKAVPPPKNCVEQLLNQYVISDLHLGMLAWGEETGSENWDLEIAERLLLDWFGAAIAQSPKAHTGLLCQLGDFLHYDSLVPVTPASKNVLDADSRFQKVARVAIRVTRQIVAMLLQHHEHVHVVWASANHDPASSAIFREMWAAFYEQEPRVTIDNSPDVYYAYEWGDTALFYHHGHKAKIDHLAAIFASKFREIYGRAKKSYGHCGHLHQPELSAKNRLMRVERHATLAPPDAYGAGGGWLSEQEASVITYHRLWGQVGRQTLTPGMVRSE